MLPVLEEHYGYLSDSRRLVLYREAVARVVGPGDRIADIGCGFGVLGLMCLEAGAGEAWGIDDTPAIEIARETMARAGMGARYHCLRERSFRAALPRPVDVVICDHVGYFGFDYRIIETLADARRRMLRPGGTIVPRRIELRLAAVAAPRARAKALAWDADDMPDAYRWLREYSVNSKFGLGFESGEIASQVVALGSIDLLADNPPALAFDARLTAGEDCVLDGLAGWFECELAPGVWMTNSPLAPDRIDRPQAFLPFDEPIAVKAGDIVAARVTARHADDLLAWSVRAPGESRWRRQSNWRSRILSEADLTGPADHPLRLSATGEARRLVATLVDGRRTAAQVCEQVLLHNPRLFPTEAETLRFVRAELARNAE